MLSGVVFSKGDPKSTTLSQNSTTSSLNICACGSTNPKFRGYCSECLIKLKATFDRYLEKFKKLSEEYESYAGADQKKADDKLRLMKNKIEQYEIKLSESEMVDVIGRHEGLSKSDENRAFAEFKVTVESLKQEIEIAKVK